MTDGGKKVANLVEAIIVLLYVTWLRYNIYYNLIRGVNTTYLASVHTEFLEDRITMTG